MDLMSRDADAENTDSMLRNSAKFIVPDLVENTTHIRSANGFSCQQISHVFLICIVCHVSNCPAVLTSRPPSQGQGHSVITQGQGQDIYKAKANLPTEVEIWRKPHS